MPSEVQLTPFVEAWEGGRRGWRADPPSHPLRTITSLDELPLLRHDVNERYRGEQIRRVLFARIVAEVSRVVPSAWHVACGFKPGWSSGPIIDLTVTPCPPDRGMIEVTFRA